MESIKNFNMTIFFKTAKYLIYFLLFFWCGLILYAKNHHLNLIIFVIILGLIFILSMPVLFFKLSIFLKWWLQSSLRKFIFSSCLGLLAITAGSVSLSLSRKIIQSAMHLDPSFFPSSIAALTSIFLIPGWLLLSGAVMFTIFSISLLYNLLLSTIGFLLTKRVGGDEIFMLGAALMASLCWYVPASIFDYMNNDEIQLVYPLVQKVVVFLDYFKMPECSNLKENQFANYLDEDRISIVTDPSFTGKINLSVGYCIKDKIF